ncbi:MAG: hypothetical protein MI724_13915 [Spirochaetales bacterium]|nr:hypothetical protein [Spirochaetales bacterium]
MPCITIRSTALVLLGAGISLSVLSAQTVGVSGESRVDLGARYLLQGNTEGEATQRLLLDVGPSRWLWIVGSTLVVRETDPAPAGYTRHDVSLRSPFTDTRHRLGISAGPATVGSVTPQGVFLRLLDPAGGGVRWAALSERDGVRLDVAPDGGRWTGGGFVSPGHWPIRPAYVYLREARSTEDGEAVTIHSGALSLGREASPIGSFAFAAYEARATPRGDDSWLFEAPPLRLRRLRAAGVTVRRNGRAGDAWWLPSITGEAWVQRGGDHRPVRRFAQARLRFGAAGLRIEGRALQSDVGFYGADGTPPGLARMVGATVSGRFDVATTMRIRWSSELVRRTLWDELRVGPSEYRGAVSAGVERPRRLLRSAALTLRREWPAGRGDDIDSETDAVVRARLTSGGFSISGRGGASTEGRRSARGDVTWSRRRVDGAGRLEVACALGSVRDGANDSWETEASGRLSIPFGRRWRGELTVSVNPVEVAAGDFSWRTTEGTLRLIGRGSNVPHGSRSSVPQRLSPSP